MKGTVYLYCKYYPSVNEWGQYPILPGCNVGFPYRAKKYKEGWAPRKGRSSGNLFHPRSKDPLGGPSTL